MGYGDAYIYAVIVSRPTAKKIFQRRAVIKKYQRTIDEIVNNIGKLPGRGQEGLALLDKQDEEFGKILDLCKRHVNIICVATDEWHEAYETCQKFLFKPIAIKTFLKYVHGKSWKEDVLKRYINMSYHVVCIPSHYDTDEERRIEIGATESDII